jgi:hypothetical protein
MTTSRKIDEAINLLWRNHPRWPSTFSKCPNTGCENPGRGGARCATCAEQDLAAIVGPDLAVEYHQLILDIRKLESRFHDNYGEN